MRRGTWRLAACGLAGLLWAAGSVRIGSAEERFIDDPYSHPAEARDGVRDAVRDSADSEPSPSRYTRPRAATGTLSGGEVPQVKNYHQALFGTERPESSSPAFSQKPGGLQTDRLSATEETPMYRRRMPASSTRQVKHETAGETKKTPESKGEQDSRLIHADYQRKSGESERGKIVPVQSKAAPFPEELDIPLPKANVSVTPSRNPFRPPFRTTSLTHSLDATDDAGLDEATSDLPSAPPSAGPPSTGPQTPSVTLTWIKDGPINVGQECSCRLVVKNTGKVDTTDVVVDAFFPSSVRLTSAQPAPGGATDRLTWKFPSLSPGEEKTIQIQLVPSRRGALETKALVRFTGAAGASFQIDEPLLALSVRGPKQVMVGDPASQIIMVTNPGTGIASNVSITAVVPSGLEHPRGERLVMDIGSLNPGESRSVRLALAAVHGGLHSVQIRATADAGVEQTMVSDVSVVSPELKLAMQGPGLRYIGRSGEYELIVSNDGAAVSNNVRVMHKIPEGFQFLSADHGGQYESSTSTITWFLGQLQAGETITVKAKLNAEKIGRYTHYAGAVSEHGGRADAHIETDVDGTASLMMEIVDLDDPVEVGSETGYEVRIRNDGSKAAENVSVTCKLPEEVDLLATSGAEGVVAKNGVVTLGPLATLPPGKAVTFQIKVRGRTDGNHRFRAMLESESITEPLTVDELTHYYGE